jgi:hypothetical protein
MTAGMNGRREEAEPAGSGIRRAGAMARGDRGAAEAPAANGTGEAARGLLMDVACRLLEALRGDRAGQFSIRINQQWRICFEWPDGQPGPGNVEIVDYH